MCRKNIDLVDLWRGKCPAKNGGRFVAEIVLVLRSEEAHQLAVETERLGLMPEAWTYPAVVSQSGS